MKEGISVLMQLRYYVVNSFTFTLTTPFGFFLLQES
jgi:hypothetical protein